MDRLVLASPRDRNCTRTAYLVQTTGPFGLAAFILIHCFLWFGSSTRSACGCVMSLSRVHGCPCGVWFWTLSLLVDIFFFTVILGHSRPCGDDCLASALPSLSPAIGAVDLSLPVTARCWVISGHYMALGLHLFAAPSLRFDLGARTSTLATVCHLLASTAASFAIEDSPSLFPIPVVRWHNVIPAFLASD